MIRKGSGMPAQAKNAMNWDDIRIFLAVARSGQILGAARRLGLNHTTVARRLTALETALSTTLLTRRTNGSTLTHAGEEFLLAAERMEAEMLSARAQVGNADIAVSGTVRIGAPDGFGVNFLAPRLARLTQKYPDLTISWCRCRALFRYRAARRISPSQWSARIRDGSSRAGSSIIRSVFMPIAAIWKKTARRKAPKTSIATG